MGVVLDLLADLIGPYAGHGEANPHATRGETGETGEDARNTRLPAMAKEWRRPAKTGEAEAGHADPSPLFAALRHDFAMPQSEQTCGASPLSPPSPGVDPENASAAPEPTFDGWLLIRPDGRSVEVYTSDRLTLSEMAARHPRCQVAALPVRTDPPPRPLTIADRMALENWLARLGSADVDELSALIARCEADMTARYVFLREARDSCCSCWHPPAVRSE